MILTPAGSEEVTYCAAADLARKRRARGPKPGLPEATALGVDGEEAACDPATGLPLAQRCMLR